MKFLISLTLLMSLLLVSSCNSDDEKMSDEVSDKSYSPEESYTQEEFDQAVQQEVRRTLQRAGQGNLVDLTKELMEKEKSLDLKKLEIKKQEEELQASMRNFEQRVQDFRQEQERFIGCIDDKDQEIDNRVSHMVNVISGMRPQNAAEVLSVQDADISVQILDRLDPDNVARIFNQMDKEISARLQKQFMNMQK